MPVEKKYHSITFYPRATGIGTASAEGSRHTYRDFFLIPATRPVIQPPPQKEVVIDIPGSYGSIDASTSLTGYPVYGLREGQLSFYVENDHEDWAALFSRLQSYLHGETLYIVLEDDIGFYYHGRFTVDEWGTGQYFSGVSLSYHLYPFKKELTDSTEDWLWDPFSFENGIIREYDNISVPANSSVQVKIPVRDEHIVPEFTVSEACKVTYKGVTYDLPKGTSENPNIVIGADAYVLSDPKYYSSEGTSKHETLTFTATTACTVTVKYRGGAL